MLSYCRYNNIFHEFSLFLWPAGHLQLNLPNMSSFQYYICFCAFQPFNFHFFDLFLMFYNCRCDLLDSSVLISIIAKVFKNIWTIVSLNIKNCFDCHWFLLFFGWVFCFSCSLSFGNCDASSFCVLNWSWVI